MKFGVGQEIMTMKVWFVNKQNCHKDSEELSELIMIGWLNKLTGVLLYLLLYGLTYSVILFYAKSLGILSTSQIASSTFYPYVAPVAPDVMNAMGNIIPFFKDLFSQLEHFFSGVSNKLQ